MQWRSILLLILWALVVFSCRLPNVSVDAGASADVSTDDVIGVDVHSADVLRSDVVDIDASTLDAGVLDVAIVDAEVGGVDVAVGVDVEVADVFVPPPEDPPSGIRASSALLSLWATNEEGARSLDDESVLRPRVELVAQGAASVSEGVVDGVFSSAGNNKYKALCDGQGSIELWVEPQIQTGTLFKYGSLHLERNDAVTLRMTTNEQVTSTFGVPDDELVHLVITIEGDDASFYVNGNRRSAGLENVAVVCNEDDAIELGSAGSRIRLLAIYAEPLSVDEVQQNFQYGSRLVRRSAVQPEVRFPIDNQGDDLLISEDQNVQITITDEERLSKGSLSTEGIEFDEEILPRSNFQNCVNAGAITLEAWITPNEEEGEGPGRIIDSADNGQLQTQSFILGHGTGAGDTSYQVRISNTSANSNIGRWHTDSDIVETELTHLVFAHSNNDSTATFYINGQAVETTFDSRNGYQPYAPYDFGDRLFRVGAGVSPDETARDFKGDIHEVAVYCTALDANTISDHYHAGPGATR